MADTQLPYAVPGAPTCGSAGYCIRKLGVRHLVAANVSQLFTLDDREEIAVLSSSQFPLEDAPHSFGQFVVTRALNAICHTYRRITKRNIVASGYSALRMQVDDGNGYR